MVHFIDEEKGPNKPVDIFKFLLSGEYDKEDVGLISYDDLYDMVYDDGRRQSMQEALEAARKPRTNDGSPLSLRDRLDPPSADFGKPYSGEGRAA